MISFSLLMATTDCKIQHNPSFWNLPFHENFTAVICNQMIHSQEALQSQNPFVTVINSTEKGVSRSRNTALAHAQSTYVHFCDDDVEFVSDYYSLLQNTFKEFPEIDFFQFQILKDEGVLYKNYPKNKFQFCKNSLINRRRILRISSVEVVAKLNSIQKNNLHFNPEMGVGSGKYPMGEEVFFLLDGLEKGLCFAYIPKPIVYHPEESSGKKLGIPQLQVLGILFHRVFGKWNAGFSYYYSWKKRKMLRKEGISFTQAVTLLNPSDVS